MTELEAPTRKRSVWFIPALMIGSALLLVAGALGVALWLTRSEGHATTDPSSSAALVVSGALTITGSGVTMLSKPECTGSGGYGDIHLGTQVVIADADGTTIAIGSLERGTQIGEEALRQCRFSFTITGVPSGKGFYGISVGRRGNLQYTEAEIAEFLDLTLN